LKPKAGSSPRKPGRLSEFAADGLLVGIEVHSTKSLSASDSVIHERVGAVLAPVWLLAIAWAGAELGAGQNDFPVARGHGPVHGPDELSSTCAAPLSRLTASTQMVRASSWVGVLLAGGDGDALGGSQGLHAQVGALVGEFAAAKPEGYPPSSSNHRCISRFLASSTRILTAGSSRRRGRGSCRPWARKAPLRQRFGMVEDGRHGSRVSCR